MELSKQHLPGKFIAFATIVFVLIFSIENINGRFWLNDFKVYYSAAQALLNGDQVYGIPFALGSGYYKYSPFTGILFIPVSLLPYKIAAIIQYFFLCGVIISLLIVSLHIIKKYLFSISITNENRLLSFAFVCAAVHFVRELHLGNINVILLLLLSISLFLILKSKWILAGILIAVVIITKPFFILLLIPLALRKYFKIIFLIFISLLVFMLIPSLFGGIAGNFALHKEWLHTMLEHNNAFPSNNTIDNLLRLYISPNLPAALSSFLIIAASAGMVIFFLLNRSFQNKNRSKSNLPDAGLTMEWFVMIALLPSLFRNDTQHFLLSLPLILIMLTRLSISKNYLHIAAFVLLMLMYGGNSSDLLGKALSLKMGTSGILGISNLLLITSVIILYFKSLRFPGKSS